MPLTARTARRASARHAERCAPSSPPVGSPKAKPTASPSRSAISAPTARTGGPVPQPRRPGADGSRAQRDAASATASICPATSPASTSSAPAGR
ncbi:hypothetical protein AAW14_21900 [Streptomyces hygroscopicus]|nr:hypothetical protein [Streptomyces hygroscopicus]